MINLRAQKNKIQIKEQDHKEYEHDENLRTQLTRAHINKSKNKIQKNEQDRKQDTNPRLELTRVKTR